MIKSGISFGSRLLPFFFFFRGSAVNGGGIKNTSSLKEGLDGGSVPARLKPSLSLSTLFHMHGASGRTDGRGEGERKGRRRGVEKESSCVCVSHIRHTQRTKGSGKRRRTREGDQVPEAPRGKRGRSHCGAAASN